ncbi:MAG TPA: DMT family protein [Arachidicoccus sp.]|nr:DMT family protein [Arachidicoccus sp.]
MKTVGIVLLLVFSNIFMTAAWYWHLKPGVTHLPVWKIILISWGIAFFEYCLTVPANHFGKAWGIGVFQLKIIQEVVTLVVFCLFAVLYLKEPFHWKYLVSFAFILAAVYFAFKKW